MHGRDGWSVPRLPRSGILVMRDAATEFVRARLLTETPETSICLSAVARSCFFSSFEPVLHNQCLAALDLGASVEQPFDCLIVQNFQAVQSIRRSMDWTLEDDMVHDLFFCVILTGRRGGHTPFVQAGAETSDTGTEALRRTQVVLGRVIPRGWEPVSGIKKAESCEVVRPLRIPLVIRPVRCTYVVVVR